MRFPAIFYQHSAQMIALVLLINIICFALVAISYSGNQASLSAWIVAYTLGVCHGFDADHIAIIDNSVRRLSALKKPSIFTGFFFALGHSSIVFIGTIIVVLFSRTMTESASHFAATGAIIATLISIFFLSYLGLINIGSILFRKRVSQVFGSKDARSDAAPRIKTSFLGKFVNRFSSKIQSSWILLPIGMLFGLGFETATEVALLANAARDGVNGVEISTILLYPCLFMAGMLAIDSINGLLMFKAFSWAKTDDLRRETYTTVISLMTGAIALVIAVIQSLSLLSDQVRFSKFILDLVDAFSSNSEIIGISIITLLFTVWMTSMFFSRLKPKRPNH
jgi:high-affinity nickel-transport protein